jgi:hypothetical protein
MEVVPPTHGESSPEKLYQAAVQKLNTNDTSTYQKDIDEVWFVIDTDDWGNKIKKLRESCKEGENHPEWKVAQSNPCFEVWLYYHFKEEAPSFKGVHAAKKWKTFVSDSVPGGFDPRKDPAWIGDAIKNARKNASAEGSLKPASTEVFKLAERFFPFVEGRCKEIWGV